MTATIKEVAQKAKVSTATVSRVMNNSDLVDEKTRKIVLQAARELHYIPNATGRSLSTHRTDAIGLLLPDLYGEFFSEVIRGSDLAAQKNKYHLLVSSSHNHREEIRAALQMMRGRVDGLIIMSPHIDANTLDANLPKALPVVLLNCLVEGDTFDAFNIDNYSGAYQIVNHLLGHGHQCIAMIKGTQNNVDAEERLRGYRAAVREHTIDRRYSYEVEGDFSEESGYAAVTHILECSPRPTAIFAGNDCMAIGAISALHDRGIRIPEEIAIAGFDDIPMAEYVNPPLSSVRVNISELGRLAVERIVHAIKQKNTHEKDRIIVPTNVVARESCGCIGSAISVFSKKLVNQSNAQHFPQQKN